MRLPALLSVKERELAVEPARHQNMWRSFQIKTWPSNSLEAERSSCTNPILRNIPISFFFKCRFDSRNKKNVATFVIVFPVEKLNLFKSFWARVVADDGRMHREESVESRRSGFLRTQHKESRQLIARLVLRPDFQMALIVARILSRAINSVKARESAIDEAQPTPQTGSLSSGYMRKYFSASWTAGMLRNSKLVQHWRNLVAASKVYRAKRSLP